MKNKPLIYRASLTPETFHAAWTLGVGDTFDLHSAGEQIRAQGYTLGALVSQSNPRGNAYWQCGHRVFEVVPFVPERECSICNGTGYVDLGYGEKVRCEACEQEPQ